MAHDRASPFFFSFKLGILVFVFWLFPSLWHWTAQAAKQDSHSQQQKTSAHEKAPQWISSETYAVKRFQEILEGVEDDEALAPTERLIRLRARLELAQRKLDQLNTNAKTGQVNPRQVLAARAQVQHFEVKIEQTEAQILKSRSTEKKRAKPRR